MVLGLAIRSKLARKMVQAKFWTVNVYSIADLRISLYGLWRTWIPTCVGMTIVGCLIAYINFPHRPSHVIPAKAGIQVVCTPSSLCNLFAPHHFCKRHRAGMRHVRPTGKADGQDRYRN